MKTSALKNALTKTVLCVLIGSMLLPTFARAAEGGQSGGGGGAILCAGQAPKLLELWEAEKGLLPFKSPLNILRSTAPVEQQIQDALKRLNQTNPVLGALVSQSYSQLRLPGRISSRKDLRVKPPTDTMQPFYEKGCELVGIGDYNDSFNILSVDADYLAKMSNTDQAAFWTHEAIYFALRNISKNTNSVLTRFINAHLYSNAKIERLSTKPINAKVSLKCLTSDESLTHVSFYLHTDGNEITLVPENIFERLDGSIFTPSKMVRVRDHIHRVMGGFASFERNETVMSKNTELAKLLIRIGQDVSPSELYAINGFVTISHGKSSGGEWTSVNIADISFGLQSTLYAFRFAINHTRAGDETYRNIITSNPIEFKQRKIRFNVPFVFGDATGERSTLGLDTELTCTQY
jgi:hypothetical protein